METVIGQLLALLTAACFATSAQVWSYGGKRIGSTRVTHIRLWFALPAILLVHLFFFGTLFPFHLETGAYVFFTLSGLCGFTLADLFIFKSLVVLGARETLVILTLSPLFGTLVSWFSLSEKISVPEILGIVVIILGVMWVVYEEGRSKEGRGEHKARGVLFAFIGALAQAGANVLSKHGFAYDVHPLSAGAVRISAGLLGLVIFALFRKKLISDFRRIGDLKLLILLILAACIGPVLGVVASLYALTMAPVGVVSALMQMSPIILLPVDRFMFKKNITVKIACATCLAIAGAVLLFVY